MEYWTNQLLCTTIQLSNHFEEDKSTLIKHSLNEMYEDLVDKRVIDDFEKEESSVHFVSAEDILKTL